MNGGAHHARCWRSFTRCRSTSLESSRPVDGSRAWSALAGIHASRGMLGTMERSTVMDFPSGQLRAIHCCVPAADLVQSR